MEKTKKRFRKIACPACDWSCPYCTKDGWCKMEEKEGVKPYKECEYFDE